MGRPTPQIWGAVPPVPLVNFVDSFCLLYPSYKVLFLNKLITNVNFQRREH